MGKGAVGALTPLGYGDSLVLSATVWARLQHSRAGREYAAAGERVSQRKRDPSALGLVAPQPGRGHPSARGQGATSHRAPGPARAATAGARGLDPVAGHAGGPGPGQPAHGDQTDRAGCARPPRGGSLDGRPEPRGARGRARPAACDGRRPHPPAAGCLGPALAARVRGAPARVVRRLGAPTSARSSSSGRSAPSKTWATTAYESGDWATALDAAREASRREPLLDAMRSIVIRSRLSLGDVAGAVHEFRLYRRFLAGELGIEPPAELASLFDGIAPSRRPRADSGLLPGPRRPRRTVTNPSPSPSTNPSPNPSV